MIKLVCYSSKTLHLKEATYSYVGEKRFTKVQIVTADEIDGHNINEFDVDLHIVRGIYDDKYPLTFKKDGSVLCAEYILNSNYTSYARELGFYLKFTKKTETEEEIVGLTNAVYLNTIENKKIKQPADNDTSVNFPNNSSGNNSSGSGANGKDGKDGKDGVTYTPSVSEDGILSWTNNGGLPNPSPIKIKGDKGNMADLEDGSITAEKLEESLRQDISDVVEGAFPPSKNLIELPDNYTKTKDGLTVTIQDGLFTVIGTATENPSVVAVPIDSFYIPEQFYTLSAKNIYTRDGSVASSVCLKTSDGQKIGNSIHIMESHMNRSTVINGGTDIDVKFVSISVAKDSTVNQSFYLQLEAGDISTYYVPAGRKVFGGDSMTAVQMLESNTVLASMFGAIGDGVTDDTAALQEAVDYCSENNKMLQLDTGKTYIISKRIRWADSSIYLDGNFATLSAKPDSDIYSLIQLDCEDINDATTTRDWESRNHRQQVIKNVILECNGIAECGLEIRKGIKTHCTDITIKDPVSYGIYVNQLGYENFISNIHITRYLDSLGCVGIFALGSDNTFNNIVVIGCQIGVVNVGGDNHYSMVHPWSTTKALANLKQSISFDCRNGYSTFSQCMGDSTNIIFRLSNKARARISNCSNTWTDKFATYREASTNPYLFYFVKEQISEYILPHENKGKDVTVSTCEFKPTILDSAHTEYETFKCYYSNLTEDDTPMLIDRATTGWENQPVTIEAIIHTFPTYEASLLEILGGDEDVE